MLCLLTLSVFFLLMQSSCPRQLFAVLSPERRVEGREEKAPVLDLLPLQSKDEGRGARKEKGKLSRAKNRTEDIWKQEFLRVRKKEEASWRIFHCLLPSLFFFCLLYRSPHACAVYSAFPSLCVHFGTCHFFPQRLQKAPGNYPECHSVCQLFSPWGCTDGAPRRLRE